MPDIIGIGESDMDLFLKVERLPEKGEKVRARELGKMPGGIIGNFCSQVARNGVSCGIVTVLGDDENGKLALADYKARGIDTRGLYIEVGQTFYCVIFIDNSGEKYLNAVVTPLISPSVERIDFNYVKEAKYVHMCSMDYGLVKAVADSLEGTKTKISLDYESHADLAGYDNWSGILCKISILFINEDGLRNLFSDRKDDEKLETGEIEAVQDEAVGNLLNLGIETVVLTCAEKGGFVYKGNKKYSYEAFPVTDVVDTTGAGDSFNATFLSCIVQGMHIEKAMECAAASAALTIMSVGARTGQPDRTEMESFIRDKHKISNEGSAKWTE